MKQLNMYFLFQIAVLEVQNKSRYDTLIEKSHEPHPGSIFLVRLIIETWCIIFHNLKSEIILLFINITALFIRNCPIIPELFFML